MKTLNAETLRMIPQKSHMYGLKTLHINVQNLKLGNATPVKPNNVNVSQLITDEHINVNVLQKQ